MARRADTSGSPFTLSLAVAGNHWVVVVTGDLDVATLPVVQLALDRIPEQHDLTLDLDGAPFVSIHALSWLHGFVHRRRAACSVEVRGLSPTLSDVCARARMDDLL